MKCVVLPTVVVLMMCTMTSLGYLRETEGEGLGHDLEEPFDEHYWLKVLTFAKYGKLHFSCQVFFAHSVPV